MQQEERDEETKRGNEGELRKEHKVTFFNREHRNIRPLRPPPTCPLLCAVSPPQNLFKSPPYCSSSHSPHPHPHLSPIVTTSSPGSRCWSHTLTKQKHATLFPCASQKPVPSGMEFYHPATNRWINPNTLVGTPTKAPDSL